MIKIAKRSNKTRAVERSPWTVTPVSFALLPEIARFAVKRASKPAAPLRNSGQQQAALEKFAGENNDTVKPAEARPSPVNETSNRAGKSPAPEFKKRPFPPEPVKADVKKAADRPSLFNPANFTPAAPQRGAIHSNGTVHPSVNGKNGHNMLPSQQRLSEQQVSTLPKDIRQSEVVHPASTHLEADQHEAARSEAGHPEEVKQNEKIASPGNTGPTIRMHLERLLKQHPDLPDQSLVLGVSEDGMPLLLDLNDPVPGAVLILGNERERQLDMLRMAITSMVTRNSPRAVQFLILSCEPQAWQSWVSEQGFQRYSIAIESAEDENIREWVLRLADWTEQRRLGERGGPAVLVVMDTLSFLPRLEYDVRLNFEWMAKEGPQAAIWPLAAISTDLAKALSGRRLLRAFKTRILGFTGHPEDYLPLLIAGEQAPVDFDQPGQFIVWAGERWLGFRLPGM